MMTNKDFRAAGEDADNIVQPPVLLTEGDLALRWSCSVKKLQADRLKGVGLTYVKIGRLVRYRIEDVTAFEAFRRRCSTSEEGAS